MTTIVLADDHPIVRQGMRGLLESSQDLSLSGRRGMGERRWSW